MAARADKILIVRDGKLVEEKIKDRKAFDFRAAKEIYKKSADIEKENDSKKKESATKKKKK